MASYSKCRKELFTIVVEPELVRLSKNSVPKRAKANTVVTFANN